MRSRKSMITWNEIISEAMCVCYENQLFTHRAFSWLANNEQFISLTYFCNTFYVSDTGNTKIIKQYKDDSSSSKSFWDLGRQKNKPKPCVRSRREVCGLLEGRNHVSCEERSRSRKGFLVRLSLLPKTHSGCGEELAKRPGQEGDRPECSKPQCRKKAWRLKWWDGRGGGWGRRGISRGKVKK